MSTSNRAQPNGRSSKEIKQPPIRFPETQKLLARLERQLGGPCLAYWNGARGSICQDDVVAFFELLQDAGKFDRIFLFLKSDGGNGQASLRIVNLIRGHCRRLVAVVPLNCASAATMIAIGADEIHMGPMAYLTAVDTSLTHDLSPIDRDNDRVSVSLDELKRVVRLWRNEKRTGGTNPFQALFQHVHPLVIGAVDRADSLSTMLCEELLSYHLPSKAQANRIASALNTRYPSHSYPILVEEASRIGLRVRKLDPTVNTMLLELNELYSEMGQKATTDFDEIRSHSNEIANILERRDRLVYFQQDKDWFYRAEERRWITMNDNSGWRKIERIGKKTRKSVLHLS